MGGEPTGIPDIRAALDQAEAALRDLAPVVRSYFNALLVEGFTEDQALQIVIGWQTTMLACGGR